MQRSDWLASALQMLIQLLGTLKSSIKERFGETVRLDKMISH